MVREAYTDQTAFDVVCEHLRKQNAKSIDTVAYPNPACKYRSSQGLKCAVGALIPDEDYQPSFDRPFTNINTVRDAVPCLKALSANFLADLQIIHDGAEVEDWDNQLKSFAYKYGLNFKERS